MRIRIEAVISTTGTSESYLANHLGVHLLGRPLKKQVVTFEEEVTREELEKVLRHSENQQNICKQFRMGANAIQIHSFRVDYVHQLLEDFASP
jgi:hypothetical protein